MCTKTNADRVNPQTIPTTTEPFDQVLYDKTMAASPYAWDDENPFDPDYLDMAEGYLQGARRAATIAATRTRPAGDCAHCGDNRYAKWEIVDLNRSLARENAELKAQRDRLIRFINASITSGDLVYDGEPLTSEKSLAAHAEYKAAANDLTKHGDLGEAVAR